MILASGMVATGGGERLDHITLEVAQGETVGIIGERGQGGTLLMKVLASLIALNGGSLRIGTIDASVSPFEARRSLFWCGQPNVVASMSACQYFALARAGRRAPGPPVQDGAVLEALGLQDDVPLDTMTPPRRRLVDILVATRSGAELVLLDRPLEPLTPGERPMAVGMLASAQAQGTTMVIAADHASDLPIRCNRVLAIEAGRLAPLDAHCGVADSAPSGRPHGPRLGWSPR